MSFLSGLDISASALSAQKLRMDIINQNIANVDTTRTENGTPYKRKTVLFQEDKNKNSFSNHLKGSINALAGNGVKVTKIIEDKREGTKEYNPTHPDADADGYVEKPNVNIVEEMVNMISASRSYEANITAINTTKAMIAKTLEIGK